MIWVMFWNKNRVYFFFFSVQTLGAIVTSICKDFVLLVCRYKKTNAKKTWQIIFILQLWWRQRCLIPGELVIKSTEECFYDYIQTFTCKQLLVHHKLFHGDNKNCLHIWEDYQRLEEQIKNYWDEHQEWPNVRLHCMSQEWWWQPCRRTQCRRPTSIGFYSFPVKFKSGNKSSWDDSWPTASCRKGCWKRWTIAEVNTAAD